MITFLWIIAGWTVGTGFGWLLRGLVDKLEKDAARRENRGDERE